jgi:hypothetical protein
MFKTVGLVSSAIENVRTPCYRFFYFEFLSFDIVSYFEFIFCHKRHELHN